MAKLYSNENFPKPAVLRLRDCGHDVLTSLDVGQTVMEISDEEVLRYATEDGRAVLTLNRKDFITLHREISSHAGIIVCTVNPDHEALARKINHEISQHDALTGMLIKITKNSPESPLP